MADNAAGEGPRGFSLEAILMIPSTGNPIPWQLLQLVFQVDRQAVVPEADLM